MSGHASPIRLPALLASLLLALSCGACATLSGAQRERVAQIVDSARSTTVDCAQPDACAQRSSLRDLGSRAFADSTVDAPRHYALILDYGQDAMLARLNLIRSATTAIDLQTYIFDEDDAGHLFLDELLTAARRGIRVRVLIDQLSALKRVDTLAALAGAHANFEIRIYNPVLGRARISYPQYLLAAACCWRKLNQRMHSKMLLVDDAVGITGGRNYQDAYLRGRAGDAAPAVRTAAADRGDLARCRQCRAGARAPDRGGAGGRAGRVHRRPAAEAPARTRRRGAVHRRPARADRLGPARSVVADAVPGAVAAGAAAVPRPARPRPRAAGDRVDE
ncbi:MAG: phospholipase D-like domain-containing protein [Gammaproteobacteria bacterium]|nr:phospholipase D-like domain-containing protein [Gammaproteobacteria bacterium]